MASTTTRAGTRQLMSVLTTPSKIASALDWRKATGGAIATLDIHADRIGVRISQHPTSSLSLSEYKLPVSPKGRTHIPEETRQRLSELVHEHKVCGFVVSWPIQGDTGLMGAACGRTLHAIEELLSTETSNQRPVFLPNRPICLWDSTHRESATADAFGRSPVYARTSSKTEHLASKEQYHQDESVVVSEIWDDFVRTHWPEIDQAKNNDLSSIQSTKQVETEADSTIVWDADSSRHPRRHATI